MRTVLAAAALALGLSSAAMAQNAPRTYDLGPVWQISYIETKPGMFDDYMAYLNSTWRNIQETDKARGDVLDYRVLAVDNPRDGIWLLARYLSSPRDSTLVGREEMIFAQDVVAVDHQLDRRQEPFQAIAAVEGHRRAGQVRIPLHVQQVVEQDAFLQRTERIDILDVGHAARDTRHDPVDLFLPQAHQR